MYNRNHRLIGAKLPPPRMGEGPLLPQVLPLVIRAPHIGETLPTSPLTGEMAGIIPHNSPRSTIKIWAPPSTF